MKKIAIGFAALIILVAAALYYLHANLDSIVKAAIEKYGTQAAHTEVSVDSVKLAISTGEGGVYGLNVSNPKGFSSAKALSMGMISVKLDTGSVTGSGPIIIREIVVDNSQVNFEMSNSGDSNLQTIERSATANSAAPAASSSGKQGRKVIINDLYIRNGQIGISHPLLQGKPLAASLPTIHLTNIGKNSGGATPSQIADVVLKAITETAGKIAASNLVQKIGPLKNVTGGASGNIINRVGGILGR